MRTFSAFRKHAARAGGSEPAGLFSWNGAEKKGYSGTAVFTRLPVLSVKNGIGIAAHDQEGRVITAEFDEFFLVNTYTPNAQRGLTRLDYRMEWEEAFLDYLLKLDQTKPVVLCGDLNVAHKEIDLKNPKTNVNNAGFTPQERECMTGCSSGFVDTFRVLYPENRRLHLVVLHVQRQENNADGALTTLSCRTADEKRGGRHHADIWRRPLPWVLCWSLRQEKRRPAIKTERIG